MKLSKARALLATAAAVVSAVGLASVPVDSPLRLVAGTQCSDQSESNYLIGYTTPKNVNIFGSRADIEFANPNLCSSDTNGGSSSVAWVMVQAHSATYPSNTAADGYAQVGYGQFAQSAADGNAIGIATFSQWTKKCLATLSCTGSKIVTHYMRTNPPSGSQTYRVYRNGSDGLIKMYAGASGVADVANYDPTGDWEPEWQATFSGETLDESTDMVGVASDHVKFDGLQRYNGGGWTNLTSFTPVNAGPGRYHKTIINGSDSAGHYFGIWTDPLPWP